MNREKEVKNRSDGSYANTAKIQYTPLVYLTLMIISYPRVLTMVVLNKMTLINSLPKHVIVKKSKNTVLN